MNDDLLELLQADITAILLNTPGLEDATILTDNEGDIESRLETSLATLSEKNGKAGLSIVVLRPDITACESELPGPPVTIEAQIQVVEQVMVNREADTGTNVRTSQAALRVLGALHLQTLGANHLYAPERNPIREGKVKTGYVSHVVTLLMGSDGFMAPAKCANVVSELVAGEPIMGLRISGSITIGGSAHTPVLGLPWLEEWNLEGRPVWARPGDMLCYWDAGYWIINLDGSGNGFRKLSNALSPVGLTGWEALAGTGGSPTLALEEIPRIELSGTGIPAVDGTYRSAGYYSGVISYTKDGDHIENLEGGTSAFSSVFKTSGFWRVQRTTPGFPPAYQAQVLSGAASPVGLTFEGVEGSTPPVVAVGAAEDTIQLSCATAGAAIYYTTDGTYPTPDDGTLYTGPIPAAVGAYRAAAYKDAMNPGNATRFTISDD